MQKLFSKFKNSHIRLFILLISSLCLGFMLTTMPKETPTWIIQVIGGIYFLEAISWAMDIHLKIVSDKLKYQQALWDKHFPPKKKDLKTEHLVYMSDEMYTPIYYKGMIVKQPFFEGNGNHSVSQLEAICEQFKEFVHQQKIIKENCMKHIVELKFGVEFPQNEA